MKTYVKLKKPCKYCDKMFRPTGKACRICDECCKKAFEKAKLKIKMGKLK